MELEKFADRNLRNLIRDIAIRDMRFFGGVSKKTVEAWKSGHNSPNGTAQRLLGILNNDKDFLRKRKY